MQKPKIISFSGKKSSGKSEMCKISEKYGYTPISFADSLKEIVCNCLNISRSQLEKEKDNKNVYNLEKNIKFISEKTLIDENIVSKLIVEKNFNSIREILQIIGTDLIRTHDPDWHVNRTREILENNPEKYYCCGDTRFKNEKMLIEDLNGQTFYIIRPNNNVVDTHVSENELSSDHFSNIIVNNKSKRELEDYIDNYMSNF